MKNILDLGTLRVIVAAADTGSISAAGNSLNLAVAAASARISAVEEAMGFRIFERSPRGVRVTPNGHILVERSRRLIADSDRLSRDMQEYGKGIEGHVQVLANSSSLLEVIPQVLNDFSRRNPRIQVEIEESSSPETQSAILKGLVDVGIVDVPMKMRGLRFERFFTDHLVIVVNDQHRLANRDEIHLAEVLDEDFIALIESTALSV
ncbi:MAG: regulatory helix-turn-helix protein, lysR family, partial [Rhodobacteraceae bacterium HLUCCA24]